LRFLPTIKEQPIVVFKYILIAAGVFSTFTNLFYCIVDNAPIYEYVLYVGVLGVGTLLLALLESNNYMCFILMLFGVLSIYDTDPHTNTIAGGVVLLLFAKRIANNILFSCMLYFVTLMVIVAGCIFHGAAVSDATNMIIVYIALYVCDDILYNIREEG